MSTIRVDNFGPSTGGTSYSARGIAKAWVNFNGTGTIAARDSENVSSITDNGTGNYTVNFSSSFGSADFSVVSSGAPTTTPTATQRWAISVGTLATTSVRIITPADGTTSATLGDFALVNSSAHGDLA